MSDHYKRLKLDKRAVIRLDASVHEDRFSVPAGIKMLLLAKGFTSDDLKTAARLLKDHRKTTAVMGARTAIYYRTSKNCKAKLGAQRTKLGESYRYWTSANGWLLDAIEEYPGPIDIA